MRRELRKAAFAVLTFAILMITGVMSLPGNNATVLLIGNNVTDVPACAILVAEQAATTHVENGAWQCIGGGFLAEMKAHGVDNAVDFAENGPGSDPPMTVQYIATIDGNAYLFEIGTSVWKFTVVDGKVVSYR